MGKYELSAFHDISLNVIGFNLNYSKGHNIISKHRLHQFTRSTRVSLSVLYVRPTQTVQRTTPFNCALMSTDRFPYCNPCMIGFLGCTFSRNCGVITRRSQF